MLIDSHAHVNDRGFKEEVEQVLKRAREAGVGKIVNVGYDMPSSREAVHMAGQYNQLWAAVGIHPHDSKDVVESDYDQLVQWASQPKVVAIGEIGLDYYRNLSPVEGQKQVFIRQIDLAKQLGKPIIIHDRDAHGDTMDILKKEAKGVRGVLHCFAGSTEMANEAIKLGFYISIAGPVTFKNSRRLQEVVQHCPLEYLLVETDCPYLTPEPHRGKRNEPAYVRYVAEMVASLKGLPFEQVAMQTTKNAEMLLSLS